MTDDAEPSDSAESDPETPTDSAAGATTSGSTSGDETALQSTYAWSPDEASCAECGGSVAARWRDDGDLVCAACKSW